MTRAQKHKEWDSRIANYRDSKKSVRQWCAANNVKPDRLWYWLRKYKTDESADKNTALVQLNQWLPLEIGEHLPIEHDNALNIKIGEACIEVKTGFDPILLSQVVRVPALC
jgi:hypothetical protein